MEVHKLKLEVKNICKGFEEDQGTRIVLDDISFNVKEGEIVTLLGPSGCGKTTMLTTIAGFKKQDSGIILLNGEPVTKAGPDKAFMFQNYALYPWKTVEKNILFPMKQAKMSVEAVSYTHLDVYKRQMLNLDTMLMTIYLHPKFLKTAMVSATQKELFSWHCSMPAKFLAGCMDLR